MSEDENQVKMNRDFKGIWIPRALISMLEHNFQLMFKICNHYYFRQNISTRDWKKLINMGLARKICFNPDEIKHFVSHKSPHQILGMPTYCECGWCKCKTYRLHSHHFPVSNKDKGVKTVEICAQCHDEYHFLKECLYTLSDHVCKLFQEVNNEQ